VTALDWLLDSDPAIRWQALDALTDSPSDEVAAERSRVATEGWGAALLARLRPGGDNREVAREQPDWVVLETLLLLRAMGLDASSPEARSTIARTRDEVTWQGVLPDDVEWHGNLFFSGEVEPCINGRVVSVGAYFGQDVTAIVDRLLSEQMTDGGWNCEDDNGATVGSFHTTINVLEGLLEQERTSPSPDVTNARHRGQEYLLTRGMFRRRTTGEVADSAFTQFGFPNGYHYDVLRGLDYLRAAAAERDSRLSESVELVEGKRSADGLWPLDVAHPNHLDFEMDPGVGQPSRWITLHALRVLDWAR
jgi:hypothetical protein